MDIETLSTDTRILVEPVPDTSTFDDFTCAVVSDTGNMPTADTAPDSIDPSVICTQSNVSMQTLRRHT